MPAKWSAVPLAAAAAPPRQLTACTHECMCASSQVHGVLSALEGAHQWAAVGYAGSPKSAARRFQILSTRACRQIQTSVQQPVMCSSYCRTCQTLAMLIPMHCFPSWCMVPIIRAGLFNAACFPQTEVCATGVRTLEQGCLTHCSSAQFMYSCNVFSWVLDRCLNQVKHGCCHFKFYRITGTTRPIACSKVMQIPDKTNRIQYGVPS
jgi:hypothetical protein